MTQPVVLGFLMKQVICQNRIRFTAGFAIAAICCVLTLFGVLLPEAFSVAAKFAFCFGIACGLALIAIPYRMRSALATAEPPPDVMLAMNRLIANQANAMAQQANALATQRDEFKELAANLAEKQGWLEAVLEQLPAGILLIDRNFDVVSHNARFLQLLGVSEKIPRINHLSDLAGWPAETIDGAPLDYDQWPLTRAVRDGETVQDHEMRIGNRDTGWFEASVSAAPIRTASGEIFGGVLLVTDMTTRRQNEERLRLLESAVIHANDAIIVLEAVSAEGRGRRVKYVNDGFTRLTGYDRDEVLGRSLHFLRGDDTDPETLLSLRMALDAATPFRTELLNYRKDGGVVWVDLSLVPVQGPDGRCSHYIMIQRDITARKVAEASLRESEELFRGIFEATSAGVSIVDESMKYVSCNPAFAAQVGLPIREVLGKTPADFTHPDDWPAQQPLLESVRSGHRDRFQFTKRYVRPNGAVVHTELTFAAIKDADGNYKYGLGVSVDVTERRKLEDQLRQSQKMEALGQMAGGIAHDFNNLLTAIIGNLALLKLAQDDPNRDLLKAIEQAATRAADLTRKLLGYARRNQLQVSAVQPGDLISEAVDILHRTLDPRIRIRVRNRTESTIAVDSTLVNQAIINLCLNARDAMHDGGTLTIEADDVSALEVDLPPDAKLSDYVRITVTDTGHGIPSEIRQRLFEPFFTTKSVGKGTGLGLSMVEGVMRQHNGWVTVESEPGNGARFALYFPASQSQLARVRATAPRLAAEPVDDDPAGEDSDHKPTVLLVDDEDMIRSLGSAVLNTHGYNVLVAEDGQDAIDIFRKEGSRIDLVILDMTMPRLSGPDAFRQMKQIDPNVRVLFSSGFSSEDVSGIEGAAGLLTKPYRPEDLIRAVRKHQGRAREYTPA